MTVPATTEPTVASKGPSTATGNAAAEPKRRGRSPLRKLTDEQELELTRLYSDTQTAVPEIARRFEVGESSVYRIAQRHGASLRTKSSADGSATPKPAAAASATAARPKRAAAPKSTRSAPRRAARRTAPSAAAATPAAATATKPRGAASRVAAPRRARRAASTPVVRGGRARFRVVFRGETVIAADSMRAALAQAEARGATQITSIALAD